MKKDRLRQALMGAAAIYLGGVTYAASNPINQDYVVLTDADWAKACTSGNINSPGGCYGDISSVAFSKINRLTRNVITASGITGGGANTVWLRKVGGGTACQAPGGTIALRAAQTLGANWSFAWVTTPGVSLGIPNGGTVISLGFLLGPQPNVATASLYNALTGTAANTDFTPHMLQGAGNGLPPTVYSVVVPTSSSNNGQATAFQQVPYVALNGNIC